ncbi:MAG: phospholipase D-like domain-containing protein [Candidatus Methanomethylophilaceae archaeon]|nr:phospholipase D-like domain-containing protein [Candidatus Methanomethylophilaceae archaeon]
MAQALDTQALNLEILDMFTHAKSRLFIISPYLSIYPNLRKTIIDADNRGVNIVVIYRKVDKSSDVIEWLSTLKHIYLGHSENLHAKYYAEDHVAIITSLNLYQYSQVNNEELGMIFDDKKDTEAFYNAFFFVQKIVEHSEPVFSTIKCDFIETKKLLGKIPDVKFEQLSTSVDNRVEEPVVEEKLQEEKGPEGFCIRCGKKIDSNSDIYYCEKCFERWKQYNNPNYQEKFCHICGKPSQTNAYRPVCKDCFPGTSEFINKKKDVVLKDHKYQHNN